MEKEDVFGHSWVCYYRAVEDALEISSPMPDHECVTSFLLNYLS